MANVGESNRGSRVGLTLITLAVPLVWVFLIVESGATLSKSHSPVASKQAHHDGSQLPSLETDAFERFKQLHAQIKPREANETPIRIPIFIRYIDDNMVSTPSNILRRIRDQRVEFDIKRQYRIDDVQVERHPDDWHDQIPRLYGSDLQYDKPNRWTPVDMPWDPRDVAQKPAI